MWSNHDFQRLDCMPEGHTLHRIARDHSKWFGGQKLIVFSPQGRFEEEAEQLSGRTLSKAEAFGKHLIYRFGKKIMHVHLGLYGKFRLHKNPAPDPRGAVRVRMVGDSRSFDLNGPNSCQLFFCLRLRKASVTGLAQIHCAKMQIQRRPGIGSTRVERPSAR